MRRMKIGDLVTLSSSGRKLKRTKWVKPGDVGVIKSTRVVYWESYEIHWMNSRFSEHGRNWYASHLFDRRDLKYVR